MKEILMNDKKMVFEMPVDFGKELNTDIPGKSAGGVDMESSEQSAVSVLVSDGVGIEKCVGLAEGEISANAAEFAAGGVVQLDGVGGDVGDSGNAVVNGNVESATGVVVGNGVAGSTATVTETHVDPIEQLLKDVKNDVGACLEPEAVAMLAHLSATRPAAYIRLRYKIKQANSKVSLVALDKAIAQFQSEDGPPATHHTYAQEILADLTVGGHKPVSAEGVLYVLDSKTNIWVAIALETLERMVADQHDGKDNCERRNDYNNVAIHAMNLAADPQFFADADVGVACPGGFYQVRNGAISLVPLTPEHRQRVRLGYVPYAMDIPMFMKFLNETFQSGREGEEEQQIARVQEIFGAAMFGLMPRYHKAVMYFDPFGRAGKGVMCECQVALVPADYVTSVSPFKWNEEYYLAALAHSRLNMVGELPENTPLPAADFKTVTGGDVLTGRHPTGRPFRFKNQAAHIFSSNHLPNTRDQSDAFFIRWLLVEFPNSRLRSGKALDIGLAERMIASELPGIAHWAMQGGLRLLKNGKFSDSMAGDRLMAKWRQSTNSLEEYISECCDIGESLYSVKRAAFYEAYVIWCKLSGRKPYAKGHVRDLLEHNIKFNISLGSKDGYELFRGVQFKNPEDVPGLY